MRYREVQERTDTIVVIGSAPKDFTVAEELQALARGEAKGCAKKAQRIPARASLPRAMQRRTKSAPLEGPAEPLCDCPAVRGLPPELG